MPLSLLHFFSILLYYIRFGAVIHSKNWPKLFFLVEPTNSVADLLGEIKKVWMESYFDSLPVHTQRFWPFERN